jgi:hypothetical protein
MKPTFAELWRQYPRFDKRELLFSRLGWDDLSNNPAYHDTCAIRMSVGLLGAKVPLPGARMLVKAGELKGKRIEPGQAKLSGILKRAWGKPEVYQNETEARDGIGLRTGVVSFFRIRVLSVPGSGGHIDLVFTAAGRRFQDCARSCFFDSAEVWFWPLK